MKILRNAGTHTILGIMNFSEDVIGPLELIEMCGRVAYQSQDKITEDSAKEFVRRLIKNGHESVLEHSAMTVLFDNCSRGFTHELVRHRIASFTQESTRYVDESDFKVVIPPHLNEMQQDKLRCALDRMESDYKCLRADEITPQNARQVLPTAIVSQIVCTANFREWRHIFKLRTNQKAHWEIRRVMINLLKDVKERVPVVFDDIVPEYTKKEARDWDLKE